MLTSNRNTRRTFVKTGAALLGTSSLVAMPHLTSIQDQTSVSQLNIVGPKEGYTPQIGTLVSMMNWMRNVILDPVRGMSVSDLDYLVDDNANSIGAMLWHLAATERFYQIHTFEGRNWGDWDQKDRDEWSIASGLGDAARAATKGNSRKTGNRSKSYAQRIR